MGLNYNIIITKECVLNITLTSFVSKGKIMIPGYVLRYVALELAITINPQVERKYKLTKQVIRKLFCRFPNLQFVEIFDTSLIYDNFNDGVCETILYNCPKLNHFAIVHLERKPDDQYLDTQYKLRLLLTLIDWTHVHRIPEYRNLIKYITSFPRLRILELVPGHMDNFQKLLPVIMELSNVGVVDFEGLTGDMDENFAENYMATLTIDKQELLLKRLSNVTRLMVHYDGFSVSSNKFICKYFNKLDYLDQSSRFEQNLTEKQKVSVCQDIVNLACSVKLFARVYLFCIKVPDLIKILSNFVSRIFDGEHKNKQLELVVADQISSDIALRSSKSLSLRHLRVTLSNRLTLKEVVAILSITMAPEDLVNKLAIDLSKYEGTVATHFYYDMFDLLKSLKSVAVQVPASYVITQVPAWYTRRDTITTREEIPKYPLVEELIFGSKANVDHCQALIYDFLAKFLNLNTLYIFYFCGTFCKEQRQVQLDLKNYKLKKLTLDITPLRNIWDKHWRKTNFAKEQFVVIQVDKQMYKVSLDWKTTCTRITKSDLRGLARGKDYIELKIIVGSLKRLDIYYTSSSYLISRDLYVDVDSSFTTVFNNIKY